MPLRLQSLFFLLFFLDLVFIGEGITGALALAAGFFGLNSCCNASCANSPTNWSCLPIRQSELSMPRKCN